MYITKCDLPFWTDEELSVGSAVSMSVDVVPDRTWTRAPIYSNVRWCWRPWSRTSVPSTLWSRSWVNTPTKDQYYYRVAACVSGYYSLQWDDLFWQNQERAWLVCKVLRVRSPAEADQLGVLIRKMALKWTIYGTNVRLSNYPCLVSKQNV